VITQEHLIKLLSKQQALNFRPGEENSYSNSNFTLLAEIVKAISHQSFRQFADSAIFKPLGMTNTHFNDDYTEIVKNRSYSYSRVDSAHYANSVLSYSNVGATSLLTNVRDMSKWIRNFYELKVGDQNDIDVLTQKTRLTNGKELNYAAGIVSDIYKGWRRFSHSGGDAGFRTFIAAYPDLKMGVIVFGNIDDLNPTRRADQMMGLFIKDTIRHGSEVKEEKKDTTTAVLGGDSLLLKKYLGYYISDERLALSLEKRNQKLYYHLGDQYVLMAKDSVNLFSMFDAPEIKFKLTLQPRDTVVTITTPDETHRLIKYQPTPSDDKFLQAYTGVYYSPELGCSYTIVPKDHRLILTNSKDSDTPLTLAGPDHLLSDYWWMSHLMITRDHLKQITGFEINSNRVMHVKFNRVEKGKVL